MIVKVSRLFLYPSVAGLDTLSLPFPYLAIGQESSDNIIGLPRKCFRESSGKKKERKKKFPKKMFVSWGGGGGCLFF